MTTYKAILSRLVVGPLTLRNRVVMAPMTRERANNGIPTPAMAEYYRRRAAGGVGLVLTEGTPPDLTGAFGSTVPQFYGDEALSGWSTLVNAVHGEGAAIFAQLWHVGAFNPFFDWHGRQLRRRANAPQPVRFGSSRCAIRKVNGQRRHRCRIRLLCDSGRGCRRTWV